MKKKNLIMKKIKELKLANLMKVKKKISRKIRYLISRIMWKEWETREKINSSSIEIRIKENNK